MMPLTPKVHTSKCSGLGFPSMSILVGCAHGLWTVPLTPLPPFYSNWGHRFLVFVPKTIFFLVIQKHAVGTSELEGTLVLQKGGTEALPPHPRTHRIWAPLQRINTELRSPKSAGPWLPCSVTPSPNWPRRNYWAELQFIRPAAPPLSPRNGSTCPTLLGLCLLSNRPTSAVGSEKSPSANPTGDWNSRCSEQDTAIISARALPPLPSWSQQHHNREQHRPEAWNTADTSLSHSLSLYPSGCCVRQVLLLNSPP